MALTNIAWTDYSFNPWWGCEKVSPGCKHCYAETFSRRVGHGARLPVLWGPGSERRMFGKQHWAEPLKWDGDAKRDGVRRRVFCASMADVFEDRPELEEPRKQLRILIARTPRLDWLLLTKRPENASRMWRQACASAMVRDSWTGSCRWAPNVWLGTTVENQEAADLRILELLVIPAAVRFLSCEPLLKPVVLRGVIPARLWVICGGESGPGARPFNLEWARSLRDQCRKAGVPFFMKQIGAHAFDGVKRMSTRDRAGADPSEWPEDLRVREWPVGGVA